MPGSGVRTVASDRQFLQFLIPGQQLTHSLPVLRHSHRVWVALEQVANWVQLQHLAGSLDDVRRWRCRALGLMEVSDGAFARLRFIISVDNRKDRVWYGFLRIRA
jgi:hypothetical protein